MANATWEAAVLLLVFQSSFSIKQFKVQSVERDRTIFTSILCPLYYIPFHFHSYRIDFTFEFMVHELQRTVRVVYATARLEGEIFFQP